MSRCLTCDGQGGDPSLGGYGHCPSCGGSGASYSSGDRLLRLACLSSFGLIKLVRSGRLSPEVQPLLVGDVLNRCRTALLLPSSPASLRLRSACRSVLRLLRMIRYGRSSPLAVARAMVWADRRLVRALSGRRRV